MIERDHEIAALLGLVADAVRGEGRLVFLGGEAGVGKTSLVTAACAAVSGQVVVRRGIVDNLPTPAALGAVLDAFPELEELLTGAVTVDRGRLFRQVRATVSMAPTVLLLEDVHWADEATYELLRFLGRRLHGLPLLVLATFREDEITSHHPLSVLMGDLGSAHGISRMTLRGLSRAGVRQLVEATGSAVDPDDLFERTDGNAFFATEILAGDADAVPRTIRDAVLARASRLSPDARHALSAAAILGRRAHVRLIAAVADRPNGAVDECIMRGVLVEDGGGVVFRHELARLSVEHALGPGARADLHARALQELLVHDPSDARALAHHAAECGDEGLLLHYASVAAESAARLGGHREAAAHYRRALRVPNVPADVRATLFAALSYECYVTDELAEAVAARRRSLELFELAGDTAAIGSAQRWLSRLSWFMGLTEESERYARRAVATLEPLGGGHELAMAYSNMAQLGMLAQDVHAALEWGDRALELARELGDRDVEIHALNNTGTALARVDDSIVGRRRMAQSLDLALADNAHEHAARAYTNLGTVAVANRRWADADEHLRAGIGYCDEHDLDSWSHYMHAFLAVSLAEQGRYDDALHICSNLLSRPRLAVITRIPASVVAARIGARRGVADAGLLAEVRDLAAPTAESQRLIPVATARAETAWLAGDIEGIVTEIDLAWSTAVAHPDPWALGELSWWLSVADVERTVPIALARPFELMLRGGWREAAAAWQDIGCPPWAALCLGLGTELDGVRAALAMLDELRTPVVRDAVLRLRHQRGLPAPRSPRTTSRGNPGQLTVRELDVLRLVATGLSNLEVAHQLFISEKTVGHHMSAVLRKLGQPTRARAVAQALRGGIVTQT
jgi:DNA-binding CsgD family transcriptional regulator/tetratricopeptide (TPR) repeat protein